MTCGKEEFIQLWWLQKPNRKVFQAMHSYNHRSRMKMYLAIEGLGLLYYLTSLTLIYSSTKCWKQYPSNRFVMKSLWNNLYICALYKYHLLMILYPSLICSLYSICTELGTENTTGNDRETIPALMEPTLQWRERENKQHQVVISAIRKIKQSKGANRARGRWTEPHWEGVSDQALKDRNEGTSYSNTCTKVCQTGYSHSRVLEWECVCWKQRTQ